MSLGRPPSQFEAARRRLRADLDAGRFGATGLLPGERDLSQQLAVSRTTIRRVVAALVAEGRLAHRQGVGTFVPAMGAEQTVAARPPDDPPASLAGFSEAMRRRGLTTTTQILSRARVEPSPKEALALGISPRERILRLRRLRLVEGEAVRIEENSLPAAFAEGLDDPGASLYAALARCGIVPRRALQRLRIGVARASEAARLGVAPGAAIMLLHRVDYLDDGRRCLFTTATSRADAFDLVLELGAARPFTVL